ncbi:MAG: ferrous iron transport protein A [Anaerotignum sp.]|nr:ferrous iron transport protein A [Anaerotignum sp.]
MSIERRITEIPLECFCRVQEVKGEGKLRLFDLGFFRGSRVLPLYECAGGGTRVYRVKDTLIALRNQDAERISVEEAVENG